MSMILDGSNGVTFNDASLQGAAASPFVLKNRIINGDMVVAQRGTSFTPATSAVYTLDRFAFFQNNGSRTYTVEQSSVAPVGFVNSMLITCTAGASASSGDFANFYQAIEGFNVADLAWGTANARTVTLSFWVQSSLTGTFSGSLGNNSGNRAYPFTFSIPTANTWTQISVTIAGDTTGTWNTTTGAGIYVYFNLGAGSTLLGTAGAWTGSDIRGVTGSVALLATTGATFYITGVQLEQNTSATPFERRLYNQELANCQRYCYVPTEQPRFSLAWVTTSAEFQGGMITNPVQMRAAPTISGVSSFTIQGITASAVGFSLVGYASYLLCRSTNSNSQSDGVLRQVNPNQIPIVSAEL